MESIVPGMFARAKAGHDKGSLYLIVKTEPEYVYLADGKRKPLSKPKKKKCRPSLKVFTPQTPDASVHQWFFTLMCMNIPIIGWFYLVYLAFNKKNTSRRNFARAYMFYKLLFLLLAAAILGALVYIGMEIADQLLAYMEML